MSALGFIFNDNFCGFTCFQLNGFYLLVQDEIGVGAQFTQLVLAGLDGAGQLNDAILVAHQVVCHHIVFQVVEDEFNAGDGFFILTADLLDPQGGQRGILHLNRGGFAPLQGDLPHGGIQLIAFLALHLLQIEFPLVHAGENDLARCLMGGVNADFPLVLVHQPEADTAERLLGLRIDFPYHQNGVFIVGIDHLVEFAGLHMDIAGQRVALVGIQPLDLCHHIVAFFQALDETDARFIGGKGADLPAVQLSDRELDSGQRIAVLILLEDLQPAQGHILKFQQDRLAFLHLKVLRLVVQHIAGDGCGFKAGVPTGFQLAGEGAPRTGFVISHIFAVHLGNAEADPGNRFFCDGIPLDCLEIAVLGVDKFEARTVAPFQLHRLRSGVGDVPLHTLGFKDGIKSGFKIRDLDEARRRGFVGADQVISLFNDELDAFQRLSIIRLLVDLNAVERLVDQFHHGGLADLQLHLLGGVVQDMALNIDLLD